MSQKEKDFEEWFNSLSEEEQRNYFEEEEADYYVDCVKSFPVDY